MEVVEDVIEKSPLNEEELLKKHRQERKDLQAQIQSLKKGVVKGDKKKKKEVTEMISKLEQELDAEQALELNNVAANDTVSSELSSINEVVNGDVPTKISRAQKRRTKKETENKEREKRIAEEEVNHRQGPRVVELNTIKELLQNEGLQIFNIPADGNCLYCAINHQLEVTGRVSSNVSKLRKLTASFIRDNKEEFLPFMYNDDDDELIGEDKFEKYCKDVANTKLWGGQLELTALSSVLKCPIKVIQASGPLTIQAEQYEGPPLILTYHKHLYRLGEHYNSTITSVDDNMQESEDTFA
ncbi:hypothetical protein PPYR_06220 [Photinus pyralis]|uniref:OTU domain-containing protein n=1 Tax=Photinus pyralis TaxID=7054 RepID=A0A1Y1KC55_PHOPY|nr:deubiquitinase OTUD6B-like [Photinus pyralis]XP_031340873.1 deubiquitinase OTUD6B-like [Photinus pyralis]XP_031344567.1 deubiquitinase OTUD6B-like [Photinus pyralis]KAB0800480.1 hypothetical protein PPYR_06220 [Photinus pyralis]